MSLDIKDGLGAAATLKTTLDGSDHVTHHIAKGGVADNAAETENPIPVAGKAVTSASYAPAYTDNDRAVLALDKASGGILAHIRALAAVTDFVSAAGDLAHDAVDSGNPVKIGGKAIGSESGVTPVGFNDRVNAWYDTIGRQVVKVGGKDGSTLGSLTARTTTFTSGTQTFGYVRGVLIWIRVTAVSGSPSLVCTIEGCNPVDAATFLTMYTFTAITGTGNYIFQVLPGITPVAGSAFAGTVPRIFRVVVTPGTADSVTYSIGMDTLI